MTQAAHDQKTKCCIKNTSRDLFLYVNYSIMMIKTSPHLVFKMLAISLQSFTIHPSSPDTLTGNVSCLNLFPDTNKSRCVITLSLIQQFCSRRLWIYFVKKIENLYNWMDNLWLKVENIVAKGRNCLFWAISSLVTLLSKSYLLQTAAEASKCVCMFERVNFHIR